MDLARQRVLEGEVFEAVRSVSPLGRKTDH